LITRIAKVGVNGFKNQI